MRKNVIFSLWLFGLGLGTPASYKALDRKESQLRPLQNFSLPSPGAGQEEMQCEWQCAPCIQVGKEDAEVSDGKGCRNEVP